jgi:hypothetical protein
VKLESEEEEEEEEQAGAVSNMSQLSMYSTGAFCLVSCRSISEESESRAVVALSHEEARGFLPAGAGAGPEEWGR